MGKTIGRGITPEARRQRQAPRCVLCGGGERHACHTTCWLFEGGPAARSCAPADLAARRYRLRNRRMPGEVGGGGACTAALPGFVARGFGLPLRGSMGAICEHTATFSARRPARARTTHAAASAGSCGARPQQALPSHADTATSKGEGQEVARRSGAHCVPTPCPRSTALGGRWASWRAQQTPSAIAASVFHRLGRAQPQSGPCP